MDIVTSDSDDDITIVERKPLPPSIHDTHSSTSQDPFPSSSQNFFTSTIGDGDETKKYTLASFIIKQIIEKNSTYFKQSLPPLNEEEDFHLVPSNHIINEHDYLLKAKKSNRYYFHDFSQDGQLVSTAVNYENGVWQHGQ